MDGKTCMDAFACGLANVTGSIFLGCNGCAACNKAGQNGNIGSITKSCNGYKSCQDAASSSNGIDTPEGFIRFTGGEIPLLTMPATLTLHATGLLTIVMSEIFLRVSLGAATLEMPLLQVKAFAPMPTRPLSSPKILHAMHRLFQFQPLWLILVLI